MSLTIEQTKKIAKLSRIGCKDLELEVLREDISKILDMVEELNEADTGQGEHIVSVCRSKFHMREDIAINDIDVEDILANAPMKEFNCFVVPKVIE